MPDSPPPSDLEQELRLSRKFSLAEAIGREGGDFLKGESPIPPLMRSVTAIELFISLYLVDSPGALQAVLRSWVKAHDAQISRHLRAPLLALEVLIEEILNTPATLYELVRQTDMKWGQIFGEPPYFQQPGEMAHPDDPYTHESVRATLAAFLEQVRAAAAAGWPEEPPAPVEPPPKEAREAAPPRWQFWRWWR